MLFSLVTLLVGLAIGMLAHTQQRELLLTAVKDRFERSIRESQSELAATYLPVQAQIALLAPLFAENEKYISPERRLAILVPLVENSPAVSALVVRWRDGSELALRPLPHAEARRRADAPALAAYRLDLKLPSGKHARYYDATLAPLGGPFVPRLSTTEDSAPSLSVYRAGADGRPDLQAKLGLKHLSAILSRQRATPSAQLAMLDADGRLLAASHGAWPDAGNGAATPTLDAMDLPILAAAARQPVRDSVVTLEHAGQRWEALAHASEIAPGVATLMLMAAPHDEILAEANHLQQLTLLGTLLVLATMLPLIWWIAHRITDPLRHLAETATAVKAFRFSGDSPRSFVREVDMLSLAMRQMRSTIQRFLDISSRLAAERSYGRLLDEIVAETATAADAGAGVVYLFEENRRLRPMAWRRKSGPPPLPPEVVALNSAANFAAALASQASTQFALSPTLAPPALAWLSAWFPGQGTRVLMVPLRNRSGEPLGLLLLARGADAGPYDTDLVAFIDALSGALAITIEKQSLLEGRKALLDGVIRMIAGAIDTRSPHTGGHCQRVPELVAMLAEAVSAHPTSPYRAAPFDENGREALHLAAWLHDCGKLFVPDYIADKSVKLEAVHNRIHEIRTRFEVLKRDAEIVCWRALAEGRDSAAARRELAETWRALDADYAFVAACNLGERELSADDTRRLLRIGARTWQRTLDDRIGISALELARKNCSPPRALPASEHLLADRLEHLVDADTAAPRSVKAGRQEQMVRPRHRLNLGELYCLGVRSGTLTHEERFLINAHILGTISMLSSLPFPAALADVPEIAGSHHEHLDGSGYPYGKRAEELSLTARIIAIADIFEALTANDRPYKPGKSVAASLAVMHDMARCGHLDPQLLDLFERAEIPVRYAAAYPSVVGTESSPG